MAFDSNSEQLVNRAAAEAVEQQARFEQWVSTHESREASKFWHQPLEIETSSKINHLMVEVAKMTGLVRPNQKLHSSRNTGKD